MVLETEATNQKALKLYERLGFVREKRMHRYYLNGVDAFRWAHSLGIEHVEMHIVQAQALPGATETHVAYAGERLKGRYGTPRILWKVISSRSKRIHRSSRSALIR